MQYWVKYRTKHSSGAGSWDYREYDIPDDKQTLEERESYFRTWYSIELEDALSTHSEHWRGIEWIFENPPISFLTKYIDIQKREVQYANQAIERAEALIKKGS